jgi:hypothetical protein
MTIRERAAVVILLAGAGSLAAAACTRAAGPPVPFAVATVHFERNATDGDVEVVFEVKGGDDGLTSLTVTAPDGRRVVAISAPDTSTMGLRQFRFESPEPTDVERLEAAYPEGVYTFAGATTAGDRYASEATLSHALPPAASVVTPADETEGVGVTGVRVTWTPVPGVASYVVTLEQPELAFELTVTLPGSATSFGVPDGVLQPGFGYTLALGTVLDGGNASFVETTFATAPKE